MVLLKTYVAALGAASVAAAASCVPRPPVNTTVCNGKKYAYNGLSGYGFIPSNARDKYGDTISIGSSLAVQDWRRNGDGGAYEGVMYVLPDRGWNTEGTVNFQARIHKFAVKFNPVARASVSNPAQPNIKTEYLDTILLKGPDGEPTTGLDPDVTGGAEYPGFPILPAATYTGDGFGGPGAGGKRVSLDSEGLVLSKSDDGFWISDEYGPYIYKFDSNGTMTMAIAPPDAILPLRNGTISFPSDNPARYQPDAHPNPVDPSQGRHNNQGFEGLTISEDGQTLYVLLQSAAMQEGGLKKPDRRHTRLLAYSLAPDDACNPQPAYQGEWVVPLPLYTDPVEGKTRVAAQSEVHYVGGTQFLVLARDGNAGRGFDVTESVYRQVDVFDIAAATDIKGSEYDSFNASIASSKGELKSAITPVEYCSFIDFNNNSQLGKFGMHNGGAQDANLLNEKWEGLALLPVNDDSSDGAKEYYLLAVSDNDFITQDGTMGGGLLPYKDSSGFDVDNQMLMFKVTLPEGAKPLLG